MIHLLELYSFLNYKKYINQLHYHYIFHKNDDKHINLYQVLYKLYKLYHKACICLQHNDILYQRVRSNFGNIHPLFQNLKHKLLHMNQKHQYIYQDLSYFRILGQQNRMYIQIQKHQNSSYSFRDIFDSLFLHYHSIHYINNKHHLTKELLHLQLNIHHILKNLNISNKIQHLGFLKMSKVNKYQFLHKNLQDRSTCQLFLCRQVHNIYYWIIYNLGHIKFLFKIYLLSIYLGTFCQ